MNRIAKFVSKRAGLSWALALAVVLGAGVLAGIAERDLVERERLARLQLDAESRAIELMSQTLNGNQMGAIGLLGLIDENVKREARNQLAPNTRDAALLMENIARRHDADGTYIVGQDGIIKSSWGVGRPLTGVDVRFRPYFQTASKGKENVYAAIGTTTGRRNLYFASPLYAGNASDTPVIGAVVMRTGVVRLDKLVGQSGDVALLLSPQGLAFSASREEWVGRMAGQPTPERIKDIRQLKQFGTMFDKADPQPLPFSVEPGITSLEGVRHAVVNTRVNWNDPYGDWTLVVMENLSRTVPLAGPLKAGLMTGGLVLILAWMTLHLLRGHYGQVLAGEKLAAYAREQAASAERKTALAQAAVRLQQAKRIEDLGRTFLSEAHHLFGVLQGVVYLADQDTPTLKLAAHYACADLPPEHLDLSEGLLGQCAVERRSQVITTAADGFSTIRSGLGDARPAAVLLVPILMNDELLGVVELAMLKVPDAGEVAAVAELVGLLAMNIEIVAHASHTEAVLTATLAADQAHTEQIAFQQALVDAIPYPVFYKDSETRFLGFNQAYEHTFGVKREDLVGKRVLDLEYLPEADRVAYQTEDEATIAAVGKVEREVRLPFADGRLHDTLYFVSGFRRADGQPGGLIGTFIDISDMKQAQSELLRLSDAERFNRLAKGRESRILELKAEVNDLCTRLSEAPRYASAEAGTGIAGAADLTEVLEGGELKLVKLNWHPSYECGQAEIDRDHRTLFAVANDLLNAIVAGRPAEAIGAIVATLVREVTQHFAREEALLEAQGYDHAGEHAAIHRALMEKATHLIDEFKAGRIEAGPFFQFLAYEVIARHMLGEDRKFFPLFLPDAESRAAAELPTALAADGVPELAEVVDLDELQKLIASFCESVGIAAAIIDLEGKVLAAARWQRACTEFHRTHPESCARCVESDTELAVKLQDGKDFTMYQCKNGMTDCASPIIVEGHHLANVFIGQFHLGPPDMEFFRQQARQFGYDETEYLKAVAAAPVIDQQRLPHILGFLADFARIISTMSLSRSRAKAAQVLLQRQAEILHQERLAAMSLAEDTEQARIALEAIAKESQA